MLMLPPSVRIFLATEPTDMRNAMHGLAAKIRRWGGEPFDTCVANGVNPQDYIADVLVRVQTHPAVRIDELLPMNWAQAPADAYA